MGSWILLMVMMPPDIITKISLILVTNLRTDIDFEYSPGYLLIMNMLPVPDIYTDTNMHPDIDMDMILILPSHMFTENCLQICSQIQITDMLTDIDYEYVHGY